MLGVKAGVIVEQVQTNGEAGQDYAKECFKATAFKEYLVTLKCKMEMVKEENRMKVTVIKLRPLEGEQQARECRALLTAIAAYMAAPPA